MIDYTGDKMAYSVKMQTLTIRIKSKYRKQKVSHIFSADDAYMVLRELFRGLDDDQEHLILLTLNKANGITGYKVLASGSQSSVPIDIKIVFRNALLFGASKIMLCHNHPSNRKKPTPEDLQRTKKVIQAGKINEIPLIDHIIITKNNYTSMRNENYCKFEPVLNIFGGGY